MTMTLTLEERKEYFLNNIEKYIIDSKGNFFHIDSDMLGDERVYIGKDTFTPEELEEIRGEWVKKVVIEQRADWEIIFYEGGGSPEGIKNKKTGYTLVGAYPEFLQGLVGRWVICLIGELGYGEGLWRDYEKNRDCHIPERWNDAGKNKNSTDSFQSPQSENQQNQAEEFKKGLEEERKKIDERAKNKENQDNSPLKQDQPTKPTNNNNENSNSPTKQQSTNNDFSEIQSQIKNQITQTLKSYNLKTSDLPKKYQNWEEQLTKLTTKEQINSLVAEINQQIENKIKELKQNQKNNNSQQPTSLTTKLLIGGGIITLIISVVLLMLKVKRKNIRAKK